MVKTKDRRDCRGYHFFYSDELTSFQIKEIECKRYRAVLLPGPEIIHEGFYSLKIHTKIVFSNQYAVEIVEILLLIH